VLVVEATPGKRPYAPRMPADERRDQLLSAALDLALERGFHALSVDGVAKACGVTRPVVYGLFGDRAGLLAALMDRAEQRALTGLASVFPDLPSPDDDVDPDELLVAGIEAYLRAVAADPRTWRVILLPPEGSPPEMAERTNAQRRLLLRHLRGLSDWGLSRRGTALDADLFARSVFTLAEGAARLLLDDPDRWPIGHFTAFCRELLSAMRPGPQTTPAKGG
jgi:AcrR family transcriptional regulator